MQMNAIFFNEIIAHFMHNYTYNFMVISTSSTVCEPILSEFEAPSCNKVEMKMKSDPATCRVSHTSSSARGVSGSGLTVRDLSVWRPYVLCLLDSEAQCRTALTDWLLRYGEQTYYDRLSRALQRIGRTDIAIGETRTETTTTHEPRVALNVWFF